MAREVPATFLIPDEAQLRAFIEAMHEWADTASFDTEKWYEVGFAHGVLREVDLADGKVAVVFAWTREV